MENISLVSWDDMFVLDKQLAKEWGWLVDKINLHEMAHTWFADWIVCRDYAHAWLKESWAVYMETCWHEDTQGADERDYDFYSNLEAYLGEADGSYMRPIMTRTFDHSWNMYDRHLYPGGAVRLHMLRHELGDKVFWAAVREYVKRYTDKVVETDDFRRVLEEQSGRSLVKWFEQWICSKGYPNLKVSFSYDSKKREGTFEVEQTQNEKDLPTFEFGSDIAWVIDDKVHVSEVRIENRKHAFTVPMAGEPQQVRFDSLNRTVCKLDFNPGDAKLKKQLTDAKDVPGRIRAAINLCKSGKRANIEAVGAAYRREKFWGARVRFAEALADCGAQAAMEILCELLDYESDGKVCEALVRATGKFRDATVVEALQQFLSKGPRLYRARAAAWEMLGAQRDSAPLELLARAAGKQGFGGWEQMGALRGLALSRQGDALGPLLASTPWGRVSTRVRPTAAQSLGMLARWLDKAPRAQAIERLNDLLRDPQQRMQKWAMMGMQAAQAVESVDALEGWGNSLSEQEQSAVRKAAFGIRASAKPKEPAKDKELDELRGKLRKLEDRFEKLESSHKAAKPEPATRSGNTKKQTRSRTRTSAKKVTTRKTKKRTKSR
jgi:aminopeptidase N